MREKKKLKIAVAAFIMSLSTITANATDYVFTTVKGDPLQTRIYTLGNGLKVYLSVNKEKPRLQTYIAVRTGSRNDPKETTGLAHYLEHLMFKGTTHFGTSDLEKERPLLDSIENRFEQYRYIVNAEERKKWYHEIDSISQLAAQYNIPNEYDKMMTAIGSEGSNAYTSNDVTCYIENIPNNEIDTWAKIESDRFQNMVIRGFHTELEAVYEEYNIGLASDGRKSWAALMKKLFPTHPYGTQTTIGTQEHLKNPSIKNIKEYFRKYYVPNNTAIIMAGDFDPDNVIKIIDKYFGQWTPAEKITRPEYEPVADLKAHTDTAVYGKEAENIMIGWKFDKGASLQVDTIEVIADILQNGKAGLFDTNLNQPMKLMGAETYVEGLTDYSIFLAAAMPKEGQTLEEAKDLMIAEIEKLKKGDFSENLVTAVINNKKLKFLRALSNNRYRTEMMKDAFINRQDWEDVVRKLDRQGNISKKQIVDFANKYLGDNYACVYKRQGNDTTIHKIEKPAITPIPTNNNMQSNYLKEIVNTKSEPIQPKFADFSTDLTIGKLKDGCKLLYKQNNEDDLFTMSFIYPVGTENDKFLSTAANYFDYVGTDKNSANDIKKQFYELACDYYVNVGRDETTIRLSGLNSNMPKALSLLENYINNAKADKESYEKYVNLELKSRNDAKANQSQNFRALYEYVTKGEYNSVRNVPSEKEFKEKDPQQLVGKLKKLGDYTLLYYGPTPEKELTQLTAKLHKKSKTDIADAKQYENKTTPQTEVYIAPYEAQNIYMVQYHNENREWIPENAPVNNLFNEYFGGGMNAIVFQELREARGLAYSASAKYGQPSRKCDREDFSTTIITQNDKMMDCINEFNNLLNNTPARQAGFDLAKQGLMKSIATSRTTKYDILSLYYRNLKKGIDYDINKKVYEKLPELKLSDIVDFARSRIANKTYKYIILGDEKNLDMKALEKIGTIHRLTTEQIFGY